MILTGCTSPSPTPSTPPPDGDDPVTDAPTGTAGENVELKVDAADVAAALAALGVTDNDAHETRDVWFYDTPKLALYDAGAILRARKVHDGPDDTTVKARPMTALDVPAGWLDRPGAKCEIDRTPANAVSSCSLTVSAAKGVIDDVAAHRAALGALFDADQLVFLGSFDPAADLSAATPLGPIPSTVWKLSPPEVATGVTLERWILRDGSALLEISTRASADQADATSTALLGWLDAHGIALAADQQSKTRAALEQFATP